MTFFTSNKAPKIALAPFNDSIIFSKKNLVQRPFFQVKRSSLIGMLSWLVVIAFMFAFNRVDAQSLRDPTLPPSDAVLNGTNSMETSLGIESGALTIIVRNDRPHLVIGTRLYAQGQKIGQVRIERITETEVWLREGRVLHKVFRFPGIQRRAASPLAATTICAPSSSKPSSPAIPCVKVQP